MKKFLPALALTLLFGIVHAEEEVTKNILSDDSSLPAEQITVEDAEACDRIAKLLNDRYSDLAVHEQVESAMQKIADENREDFEVALRARGVDAEDQEGNIVRILPLPVYFIIR